MNVIYITHDLTGGGAQFACVKTLQQIGSLKPRMNIGHSRFDITPELELLSAFGYFNNAHFASPIVDILEKMFVDRAKMHEIEPTRRNGFR